jgi:uncharacterized protein (TIGR02246 family)
MRKLWMLAITVVLLAPEIVAQEKAGTTDQEAIKKIVAEYSEAWNRHDARALSMFYAQDGDLVSATGSMSKGRVEIEKALSRNFSASSKGGKRTATVQSVRFIRPGVALADVAFETVGEPGAEGKELSPTKGYSSLVMTKKDGKWWITAQREMQLEVPPESAGPIRGNSRTKVYYWPRCPDFEKVPQKELTIFGTKEEAERAGYRAAQNCP